MICIIDYGLGNRSAILNMLKRLGIPARLSGDPDEVAAAERLILPGVGAFDTGMANLTERGLIDPIRHAVTTRGVPMLGICLGMQLLCAASEEGVSAGLGLVRGRCIRFVPTDAERIKVPHMGWAELDVVRPSRLFGAGTKPRFYFVHSYYVACDAPDIVTAEVRHGVRFAAALEQDRLFGVQFHPEKSHRFGMKLLQAFAGVA
ncbi:MAG: imidazole glycerol phosphate synthase subunit HisH [Xanthobacteraceae bacterium]